MIETQKTCSNSAKTRHDYVEDLQKLVRTREGSLGHSYHSLRIVWILPKLVKILLNLLKLFIVCDNNFNVIQNFFAQDITSKKAWKVLLAQVLFNRKVGGSNMLDSFNLVRRF